MVFLIGIDIFNLIYLFSGARAAVCIALVFQCLSFLVGFVAMDCTTLMPTYPGADEGKNKSSKLIKWWIFQKVRLKILILEGVRADIKRKMILAIGGINIFCGVVMCVGVSYYASTVLQDRFIRKNMLILFRGLGLIPICPIRYIFKNFYINP